MFAFRARIWGVSGLLCLGIAAPMFAAASQDPTPEQGTAQTAPAVRTPVDARLLGAMERYRKYVADPSRLVELEDISFVVRKTLPAVPASEEEEAREARSDDFRISIKTAPAFRDWRVRIVTEAEGQELVMVSGPNDGGFATLSGVLQGHPIYGQQAQSRAFQWSIFVLRWLNPDLPLFGARYDQRIEMDGKTSLDRILLSLTDPESGEPTSAWGLVLHGQTGAPLSLETYAPDTYKMRMRLDFDGYQEVGGLRFPKSSRVIDATGAGQGSLEFLEVAVDQGLSASLFVAPEQD